MNWHLYIPNQAPGCQTPPLTYLENTMTTHTTSAPRPHMLLGPALWLVQALLAAFYVFAGVTKLMTPADQLVQMMP